MTNVNLEFRLNQTIADQAQEIIWLKNELKLANDRIRQLYETITNREEELRQYRYNDPELKKAVRSIFGQVYESMDKRALAHEAATNMK